MIFVSYNYPEVHSQACEQEWRTFRNYNSKNDDGVHYLFWLDGLISKTVPAK